MNPDHDLMRARLRTAAELHDVGVAMKRLNLRRAHPDADEAEITAMLTAWLHERPGAEFGDGVGRPVPWPRR